MATDLSNLLHQFPDTPSDKLSGEAYPLEQWQPQNCGKMDLIIESNGRWRHNGSEIKREKLILLFSKVLCKEGEIFYLKTPTERIEITVEDAAFMIVDYEQIVAENNQSKIFLITNIGDKIPLSQLYPLYVSPESARPYIKLWRGLTALISRSVYYQLIDIAMAQQGDIDGDLWLSVEDGRFNLGATT